MATIHNGRMRQILRSCMSQLIRRGKLNSRFIVIDFSILHAGGRSLFRFQTHRIILYRVQETPSSSLRSPRPCPWITALEGAGQKRHIVSVFNMKYEIFEKIWLKSMLAVTINCEFSLPRLIANCIYWSNYNHKISDKYTSNDGLTIVYISYSYCSYV
jgi:hypothetical protein